MRNLIILISCFVVFLFISNGQLSADSKKPSIGSGDLSTKVPFMSGKMTNDIKLDLSGTGKNFGLNEKNNGNKFFIKLGSAFPDISQDKRGKFTYVSDKQVKSSVLYKQKIFNTTFWLANVIKIKMLLSLGMKVNMEPFLSCLLLKEIFMEK